jgi:hypothetical protein
VNWPIRSIVFNPLDFCLWRCLKYMYLVHLTPPNYFGITAPSRECLSGDPSKGRNAVPCNEELRFVVNRMESHRDDSQDIC